MTGGEGNKQGKQKVFKFNDYDIIEACCFVVLLFAERATKPGLLEATLSY